MASNNLEHEALFLIYEFMKHCMPSLEARTVLESELDRNGMLGHIYSWDGSKRQASIQDLERKYHNISPDMLIKMLKSSTGNPDERVTSVLNYPMPMRSDRVNMDEVRSVLTRLADLSIEESRNRQEHKRCETTLRQLEQSVTALSDGAGPPITGNLDVDVHKEMEDDCSAPNTSDTAVVAELKLAGLKKQLRRQEARLSECGSSATSMAKERQSLVTSLAEKHPGSLVSGIHTGVISSGVEWVLARQLGQTRYGVRSGGINVPRLSTHTDEPVCSPVRHATVGDMVVHRYNLLWATSGHLLHPAYCCVMDRSGRYVVTGADDYLVKVWDLETGQLVRTCRGHPGHISFVAISPDNSLMASACTMGSVRLWRFSDGRCLHIMKHNCVVNWMQFDPCTSALLSAGDNGNCIVLDLSLVLGSHGDDGDSGIEVDDIALSPLREFPLLDCAVEHALSTDIAKTERAKFKGLMSWNRDSSDLEPTSSLCLPHIKDGLSGKSIRVSSLDVCCVGGLVVTGSEDGVARLWRFNDPPTTADSGTGEKELRRPEELEKLRGALSEHDYQKVLLVGRHLVCRLEGHMDAVTDVRFSNSGDRICTGSLKDGTVRLWSFSKSFTKCEHIILSMNDDADSLSPLDAFAQNGRRPGRSARVSSKPEVYNVCWTCNDQNVVVVHSCAAPPQRSSTYGKLAATRCKVYDSMNGQLLHSFHVSNERCHVLATHPLCPYIAFTGGNDGYLKIWNIQTGAIIDQHRVGCPPDVEDLQPDSSIEIVDASFSKDGTRVAVTDFIGRVIVIGRDDPARYTERGVYPEQYFSTDYAEVFHDENGWPIDGGTQLPLHEAPVGPLVSLNGSPYPQQPRYLSMPRPLTKEEVKAELEKIFDWARSYSKARQRIFFAMKRLKHGTNATDGSGRVGRQSNRPNVWGSALSRDRSGHNSRVHTISDLPRTSERELFEHKNDIIYLSDEQDDTYGDIFSDSDDSRDYEQRGRDRQRTARYGLRSTDDSMRSGRRLGGRRRRNRQRLEEAVGENASHERAQRAARRRATRLITEDSEDISSDNSEESGESDGGAMSLSEDSDNGTENAEERSSRTEGQQKKEERKGGRRGQRKEYTKQSNAIVPWSGHGKHRTVALGTRIDRDWLLQDTPSDLQYSPQIGDRVLYLPQGHLEHLNRFPETRRPPWMLFPHKWPVVECLVTGLTYQFPSQPEHRKSQSVVVRVSLKLIGRPVHWGREGEGHIFTHFSPPSVSRHDSFSEISFEVTLRHSEAPDFLVPWHVYIRSSMISWAPGSRFITYFEEPGEDEFGLVFKDYPGVVEGVSDSERFEWPQSPWEALQIHWGLREASVSEEQLERVSPWDAFPIVPNDLWTSVTAPSLPEELITTLVADIEAAMTEEDFHAFCFPVDERVFADYYCFVPVPMYLDLIKRRLVNKYYRQVDSLLFDISLVLSNCEEYNADGTPIIADAMRLVERLKAVLSPWVDSSGNKVNESANSYSKESYVENMAGEASSDTEMASADPELVLRVSRQNLTVDGTSSEDTGTLRRSSRRGESARQEGDGTGSGPSSQSRSDLMIRFNASSRMLSPAQSAAVNSQRDEQNREDDDATLTIRVRPGSVRGAASISSDADDINTIEASNERPQRKRRRVRYMGDESEDTGDHNGNISNGENKESSDSEQNINEEKMRTRRATRSSRSGLRSNVQSSHEESSDSEEDVNEEKMRTRRATRSSRSGLRSNVQSSHEESSDSEEDAIEENVRTKRTTRSSRSGLRSNLQSSHEESSDSEEDAIEENVRTKRTTRSSRSGLRSNLQSSHEESSDSEEDVNEENVLPRRTARSSRSGLRSNVRSRHEKESEPSERVTRGRITERHKQSTTTSGTEPTRSNNRPSRRDGARVSDTLKEKMTIILDGACENDSGNIFAEPVDERDAPGYLSIITHPMDFSLVRAKLNSGKYKSIRQLSEDIMLIFDNCELYNEEDSAIFKESRRQRREIKKLIAFYEEC